MAVTARNLASAHSSLLYSLLCAGSSKATATVALRPPHLVAQDSEASAKQMGYYGGNVSFDPENETTAPLWEGRRGWCFLRRAHVPRAPPRAAKCAGEGFRDVTTLDNLNSSKLIKPFRSQKRTKTKQCTLQKASKKRNE